VEDTKGLPYQPVADWKGVRTIAFGRHSGVAVGGQHRTCLRPA
jgi:hypothetical protein